MKSLDNLVVLKFNGAAMGNLINWLIRLTARIVTLETARPVLNSTTDVAITAAQATRGITVSNIGASAEVIFSLPSALPGMRVTAVVMATQLLALDPVDTHIVYGVNGVALTEDVAIKANAIGETIQLVCIVAGYWSVVAYTGTWSATAG